MTLDLRGMTPLLQVFDMPRSIQFYRDVLGFALVETSPPRGVDDHDWAWLRRDGIELMLNTAYEHDSRPAEPEPSQVSIHADTALFIGCPDVDGAYQYLVSKGIILEPPKVAPYGMKQLYFHDPDGYNICLQWSAK